MRRGAEGCRQDEHTATACNGLELKASADGVSNSCFPSLRLGYAVSADGMKVLTGAVSEGTRSAASAVMRGCWAERALSREVTRRDPPCSAVGEAHLRRAEIY